MDNTSRSESLAGRGARPPFHGGDTGSNPVGDANKNSSLRCRNSGLAPIIARFRHRNSTPIAHGALSYSHRPGIGAGFKVSQPKERIMLYDFAATLILAYLAAFVITEVIIPSAFPTPDHG